MEVAEPPRTREFPQCFHNQKAPFPYPPGKPTALISSLRNLDSFQVTVILQPYPTALEHVEQSRNGLTFIPGAGGDGAHEIAEGQFATIDFVIRVFHGCSVGSLE
jgi:hypothetical protein